jgi:hypothetical protein
MKNLMITLLALATASCGSDTTDNAATETGPAIETPAISASGFKTKDV